MPQLSAEPSPLLKEQPTSMQFYEQALSRYNQAITDPKRKNYFEITLTLVLLIVLLVMIYPAVTHILTLNKEIQAGKVVEGALEEKLLALEQAKANLTQIEADLPLLELALPVGSDVDKYLQKPIESLSAKNGLNLKSIQFNDIPVSKPTSEDVRQREMAFTATLSGNFASLLTFITDLENFVRVTNVDTLQLKATGAELSITVSGTTGYLGTPITVPNQSAQQGAAQWVKTSFPF